MTKIALNYRNVAHVHSPGSQSSKGSSSLDQDYINPPSETSDVFANFFTNNYANNYYVADQDGSNSAESVDNLGLDEIDEIDTNNMAIYSANLPIKKERRNAGVIINSSEKSTVQKQQKQPMKKEPTPAKAVKMLETPKVSPSHSKSLLLPKRPESVQELNAEDADLMLNILGDQSTDNNNSAADNNQNSDATTTQNVVYDETSQVSYAYDFPLWQLDLNIKLKNLQQSSGILDEDLFGFAKVEQENTEDLTVTKYNPKHEDIMRLNSISDYSSHIDNVQNDLDSLKDLLSADTYQLDQNDLMGVSEEATLVNETYQERRRKF